MRQHLLGTIMACAAGLALSAQAQSSTGSTGGSSTDPSSGSGGSPSTYPSSSTSPGSSVGGTAGSQSGWAGRHMSPTGRMGHEAVRGSQLTGAQVTGSTGTQIGTISDTIVNAASGRLEFAVLSLSGNAATGATGATTSDTSSSTSSSTGISSSSTLGGGKQVAVPWMLLRPSPSSAASSAASTSTSSTTITGSQQQPSFVFAGDANKLQSAPNFDANTDLTQPSWRQSVFSYFGLGGGYSATGAAEAPGGTSSSTSGETAPQSSTPAR